VRRRMRERRPRTDERQPKGRRSEPEHEEVTEDILAIEAEEEIKIDSNIDDKE